MMAPALTTRIGFMTNVYGGSWAQIWMLRTPIACDTGRKSWPSLVRVSIGRGGSILYLGLVSGGLERVELGLLCYADRRVVDDAWFDDGLLAAGGRHVLVDAHDDVLSRVDARLTTGRSRQWYRGGRGEDSRSTGALSCNM